MSAPSRGALALAALLAAAPSPAPITPRFAWPERFHAQVTERALSRFVERDSGQRVTRQYTLTVEPRGAERWLVPGELKVSPPTFQEVFPALPTVVIDASGRFLRAEVPPELLDGAPELKAQASEPGMTPGKLNKLREALRQRLQDEARQQWDAWVGRWRGRTLRPGTEEKRKTSLTSSQLTGVSVEAEERVRVEGPVPCEPGGAARRCVRILSDTEADAKALERAAREYEARSNHGLPPKAQHTRVMRVELRTSLELVTEPDTLVPHHVHTARVDWMVYSSPGRPQPGGQGQHVETDDTFSAPSR